MKKYFTIWMFLLIGLTAQAQSSKYESEWKKVAIFENDELPQSASKQVEAILQKAIADKNTQETIKALIYRNKYKLQIDWQDKEELIVDLQKMANQSQIVTEKSILHSMLAELYASYYQYNNWQINERTNLGDFIPQDMKEWTANIFLNKIIEQIELSKQEKETLKKHKASEFDILIYKGENGAEYYPTLYDLMMWRAIQIARNLKNVSADSPNYRNTGLTIAQLSLPADEYITLNINGSDKRNIAFLYIKDFFADVINRNMIPAIINLEIIKISLINEYTGSYNIKEQDKMYLPLIEKYKKHDECVELIDAMTSNYTSPNNDNYKADIEKQYATITKAINDYPNYKRIGILKDKIRTLEMPELKMNSLLDFVYTDSPIEIDILHKNIQLLNKKQTFNVYKQKGDKDDFDFVKNISIDLSSKKTYLEDTLKLNIGKLKNGIYRIHYNKEEDKDSINYYNTLNFRVSRLATYSRKIGDNNYEIFVVDRMSGKPIEGATVKINQTYNNKNANEWQKDTTQLRTNQLGLALFTCKVDSKYNNYWRAGYSVILGNDSAISANPLDIRNSYTTDEQTYTNNKPVMSIFTDRAIYRPGQTVYYKAIVLDKNNKTMEGKQLNVKLFDENNQKFSEQNILTNEFGSASGQFVLPQGGLNGQYYLRVDEEETYFSVEEYKRPTFEITFDTISATYAFGQQIKLTGRVKNFSGVNLQNINLRYDIIRKQYRFWESMGRGGDYFANGEVKTDENGAFEIAFTPQAADMQTPMFGKRAYSFNVEATASDLNGETQQGSYSVNVGEVSMLINLDMPQKIEKKDDSKITITAANLQGKKIETTGKYTIHALNEKGNISNLVAEGKFQSGVQAELKTKMKLLASAKYRLQIKALDDKMNEVVETSDFILYSFDDKKPPIKTNNWLLEKNKTWSNAKPAEIVFGVSDKDVYVLYELQTEKQVVDRKFIKLSDANKIFKIPYKEEYGEKAFVSFTLIKNGKFSYTKVELKKAEDKIDTELIIKTEVFRNKLRPGQHETWTLTVKDKQNKPAFAELLASMYDSSLDKIVRPNNWSLNRFYDYKQDFYPSYFFFLQTNNDNPYPTNIHLKWDDNYNGTTDRLAFDCIRWFEYPMTLSLDYSPYYVVSDSIIMFDGSIAYAGIGTDQKNAVDSSELYEVVTVGSGTQKRSHFTGSISKIESGSPPPAMKSTIQFTPPIIANDETVLSQESGSPESQPQIRRNFNETAFFFPHLKTNEKGETLISFTAPETNTTWKFRALAHDKEGKSGLLEQLVITQKELMVTPNLPRFVRQGDITSIYTKISNLSDNAISGEVYLELFDPITDKPLNIQFDNQQQTFSIESEASTYAEWSVLIPSNIDLIGCRIVAKNATFSDGEQHTLSVLPNRMLVTESMPMDMNKAGKKVFVFDKLLNNKSQSLDNYRLTLEYSSNPAWYAIKALPTLSNPSNENAINWFAAYYVNSLGASIVKRYPKVTAMIEAWKKQGGNESSLASKLENDQELKNVLLDETPWVLDAKSETEQMQRLSLLFDLNNTSQLTKTATDKLKDLQTNKGGWSWYKGMNASRSISHYILYGYAELVKTGHREYDDTEKMIQIDALKFIDSKIVEEYEALKKVKDWQKTDWISTSQLEYLFVRSYYRDIPIEQKTRQAERFYTAIANTNWKKLNLYQQSLLVMLLKRNGDKTMASKIAKSIAEHAKTSEQLGMYWPNNTSNVFVSLSGVSTHTFLMKALIENGASENEINAMKQWLIVQKQTQIWESTHATIDAVNMLLSTGKDWFAKNNQATIKVGNMVIPTTKSEIGTGYMQQSWSKTEIKSDMAKVEIETTENQPSYGAMYWQYYEDLNKIESSKTQLNIEKKLFKELVDSKGKSLVEITQQNPLKVGDRVTVRLTVRSDRDMEFVSLKDMRASCFEPNKDLSGTKWQNNLLYYQMTKDASTNFYFDFLPKGTYVFEYPVFAVRKGEYSNGISSIECLYAPQFISHTSGITITVK